MRHHRKGGCGKVGVLEISGCYFPLKKQTGPRAWPVFLVVVDVGIAAQQAYRRDALVVRFLVAFFLVDRLAVFFLVDRLAVFFLAAFFFVDFLAVFFLVDRFAVFFLVDRFAVFFLAVRFFAEVFFLVDRFLATFFLAISMAPQNRAPINQCDVILQGTNSEEVAYLQQKSTESNYIATRLISKNLNRLH